MPRKNLTDIRVRVSILVQENRMAYGAKETANLIKGAGGVILFGICLMVCWVVMASELRMIGQADPAEDTCSAREMSRLQERLAECEQLQQKSR